MHRLDLPAGSIVRFSATARAGAAVHQWNVRLFEAGRAPLEQSPRLAYGSRIGGTDRDQRIEAPAQDVDCRLEVSSQHAVGGGWRDDEEAVESDTPSMVTIGFCDPSTPGACRDEVLLSFTFSPAAAVGDPARIR